MTLRSRLILSCTIAMCTHQFVPNVAFALQYWGGRQSTNWFDPLNWPGNNLPTATDRVAIWDPSYPKQAPLPPDPPILFYPVYNDDSNGTQLGATIGDDTIPAGDPIRGFEIGSSHDAEFTMQSGKLTVNNGRVALGNGPYFSRWTQNGGTVEVNNSQPGNDWPDSDPDSGGFRVATANGASAEFNMNGGLLNLTGNTPFTTAGTGGMNTPAGCMATLNIQGGEISASSIFLSTFFRGPSASYVKPKTTVNMTGGVLRARNRMINFGTEGFDQNGVYSELQFNMSGGLVEAAGMEPEHSPADGSEGALRFLGGTFDFSGGIIRGAQYSSRATFEMDFSGGVLEIVNDLADEVTTGVFVNRGLVRLVNDKFNAVPRLFTTLPDHFLAITFTEVTNGPDIARAFAAVRGDFNLDGKVDAADYVVWRKAEGTSYSLPGVGSLLEYGADHSGPDGVGDGVVDQYDFAIWRANCGRTLGGGAGLSVGSAVPEPAGTTLVLCCLAFGAMHASSRRGRATSSWMR